MWGERRRQAIAVDPPGSRRLRPDSEDRGIVRLLSTFCFGCRCPTFSRRLIPFIRHLYPGDRRGGASASPERAAVQGSNGGRMTQILVVERRASGRASALLER